MIDRRQRASFWCERHLKRTLSQVVNAITELLEDGEDEKTIRETLRQRYQGMPVSTVVGMAQSVLAVRKFVQAR